ncbi:MAG: hypothetical protein ACK4NO_02450 [Glycocaulis sp.]
MVENDAERSAINVLPQNENVQFIFGIGFELFGKIDREQIDILKPFEIEVAYADMLGRRKVETTEINIAQYRGLRGMIQTPHQKRIADSLEKISKQIDRFMRTNFASTTDTVETTGVEDSFVTRTSAEPRDGD